MAAAAILSTFVAHKFKDCILVHYMYSSIDSFEARRTDILEMEALYNMKVVISKGSISPWSSCEPARVYAIDLKKIKHFHLL